MIARLMQFVAKSLPMSALSSSPSTNLRPVDKLASWCLVRAQAKMQSTEHIAHQKQRPVDDVVTAS